MVLDLDVYEEETQNVYENREDDILMHSTTGTALILPECHCDLPSGIPDGRSPRRNQPDDVGQCDGLPERNQVGDRAELME